MRTIIVTTRTIDIVNTGIVYVLIIRSEATNKTNDGRYERTA